MDGVVWQPPHGEDGRHRTIPGLVTHDVDNSDLNQRFVFLILFYVHHLSYSKVVTI